MAPKEKKSKAEKAAEKKAAEEAAAAEKAEADRIAAEKAEAERLQREKEEAEAEAERQRLAAELEERLVAEDAASAPRVADRAEALRRERAAMLDAEEWERFVECGALPDVGSEAQTSAFLSDWREAPAAALEGTLAGCELAHRLALQLEREACAASARGDEKQAAWQRALKEAGRAMVLAKVDGATGDFLSHADEHANARNEVQYEHSAPSCKFGLWVNLAKNPRIKSIEFDALSITTELPKQLALASIALRVMQFSSELLTPQQPPLGASSPFMALGGVLSIELMALPQPPKKVKGWTIRPVAEAGVPIVRQSYPTPAAGGDGMSGSAPPLRITFTVAPTVLLPEGTPRVGGWDADAGAWKVEGISEIEVNAETRAVSFVTPRLTALALLQHSHLELPYATWIWAPRGPGSGRLSLQTQRYLVSFDVSDAGVLLVAPKLPELQDLLDGAPTSPAKLLLELKSRGLNLCPHDDHAEGKELTPKQAALEKVAHEQLASIAPGMLLASSKWNDSLGPTKLLLRIGVPKDGADDGAADEGDGYGSGEGEDGEEKAAAEAPSPFAALDATAQTLLIAEGGFPSPNDAYRYATLATATDADETCVVSPLDGEVAHSTVNDVLASWPPAAATLGDASSQYTDTLRQLLDAIRPLSFTKM